MVGGTAGGDQFLHGVSYRSGGRFLRTTPIMDHDNLAFMAHRTESSIVIAAPPGLVLSVIADFEAYPEWQGTSNGVGALGGG